MTAVGVHCAHKAYGHEPARKLVLDGLDMTVDRGTIYGLLGPSGCGKTTLLSCIVGRRTLDSGEIWVLGGKPGSRGSGVPGSRIGYMPQDIALVAEFTVKDAVYYFGRIFGMSSDQMHERFTFLSDLLDLPPEGRLLKNLSGGQQRRVSFAAAMVQDPELLILDEPTVGLDPVLREKIWNYLVTLAECGTTVIITTHYIDETKQAHKIGLLRGGRLLAEESPSALLRRFSAQTLEEAFLQLAHKQVKPAQPRPIQAVQSTPDSLAHTRSSNPNNYDSAEDFTRMCNASTDVLSQKPPRHRGSTRSRYGAIFIKSMQQFARHPGGLIFAMLFPIIQVVAFFSAIGHDPRALGLAVVNDELDYSTYGKDICQNRSLVDAFRADEETCTLFMTSCRFLQVMRDKDIHEITYESLPAALDAVRRGTLYGALHIPRNFSESLEARFRDGTDVEDGPLNTSSVSIWLDMTNHQISHYVKKKLYEAYESFSRGLMTECGFVPDMAQIPIRFNTPVFGESDPKYSTFMAPGAMMTILFFLAATITSTLMISDRLEGVWERSAVAGVKPHEVLTVHISIHSAVIFFQTIEMMILAFILYGLPYRGQLLTLFLLLFLQGLSGMCYGFLLSICCSSYTLAFFISTGSFYPMILLCGILWPLEGMSTGLRIIALMLPFTIPSISCRDIVEKGFTIFNIEVIGGFLVTITWIAVTLALCLIVLRMKKN